MWQVVIQAAGAVFSAFSAVDEMRQNRRIVAEIQEIKDYVRLIDAKINHVIVQNIAILIPITQSSFCLLRALPLGLRHSMRSGQSRATFQAPRPSDVLSSWPTSQTTRFTFPGS